MEQKVPFKKEITFKTKIGEITAISLEHDLSLTKDNIIKGNFYISGNYKMLESSTILEDYNYKIPCEIAISEEYDTKDITIDIDDFYYEIIDEEILCVNIVVVINNLIKKERIKEEIEERCFEEEKEDKIENTEKQKEKEISKQEPIKHEYTLEKEEEKRDNMSFYDMKETVKNQNDTYLTYKVYIVKENDTVDKIIEKYSTTKEDLEDYNDLESITAGTKLVIPSINVKL